MIMQNSSESLALPPQEPEQFMDLNLTFSPLSISSTALCIPADVFHATNSPFFLSISRVSTYHGSYHASYHG